MSLSWSAILAWHRRRYPLLKPQDIYKLVHQGVFGPGHIITSVARASFMLKQELATLEVRSPKYEGRAVRQGPLGPMAEPELEEIDPRGRLVRVNLRPIAGAAEARNQKSEGRRQNVEVGWLVEALVESGRRVKGDPVEMERRLSAAVRWCRTDLPRQAAELQRIAAQAEESGYPAFHHSPGYKRAYRPAYRVVLSGCLRRRASGRGD